MMPDIIEKEIGGVSMEQKVNIMKKEGISIDPGMDFEVYPKSTGQIVKERTLDKMEEKKEDNQKDIKPNEANYQYDKDKEKDYDYYER